MAGSMNMREWLVNVTKYRGKPKIDTEKVLASLGILIRSDGTLVPWPINDDDLPKVEVLNPVLTETDAPLTNADAFVIVSDDLWEVVGIIASANVAVAALTRTPRVFAKDALPVPTSIGNDRTMETSTISLTSDEDGIISMPSKPYHFTNDDGTIAVVADENILPYIFSRGAIIGFENSAANSHADDRYGITVKYRKVA